MLLSDVYFNFMNKHFDFMKLPKSFRTKMLPLSLIAPAVILFCSFFYYKKSPVHCGKTYYSDDMMCNNFLEFLSHWEGFIWIELAIINLGISLFFLLVIFVITKEKQWLRKILLFLFFSLLFFMYYTIYKLETTY